MAEALAWTLYLLGFVGVVTERDAMRMHPAFVLGCAFAWPLAVAFIIARRVMEVRRG